MSRTAATLAALTLLLVSCYDRDEHRTITDPVGAGIISVAVSETSVPADGASTVTITATLDPRTATDRRSVTFTTTNGTFAGATGEAKSIEVTADATGRATATLRSGTTPGSATVTVTAGGFALVKEVAFTTPQPETLITIRAGQGTAPADGATLVPIVAEIAPHLSERTVTFTTTAGTFLPGGEDTVTAPADNTNRATVDLRAPAVIGVARIRATIAGVSAETTITFGPAAAESVTLVPAAFDVPAGGSVTLTATVTRASGSVTSGQTLTYTAETPDGTRVGFFTNATASDDDDQATVLFVPNGTTYRGVVTITARVNGTNTSGATNVRIVDDPA